MIDDYSKFWLSPANMADKLSLWAKGEPIKNEEDDLVLTMAMAMILPTEIQSWKGVWMGEIEASRRLFIAASLDDPVLPEMQQADFNFLTLADVPNRDMAISRKRNSLVNSYIQTLAAFDRGLASAEDLRKAAWKDMADIEIDVKRFCEAFSEQAIREAGKSEYRLFGQYEMERVELPYLDNLISYDALRLVFYKDGVRGSIVKENMYTPFVWRPERQSSWMFGAKIAWALHMLMAGIWRDACVVQESSIQSVPEKYTSPAVGPAWNRGALRCCLE